MRDSRPRHVGDRVNVELVRSALQIVGRAVVTVTGTSMVPAIRPGTRVTITARPFPTVRPDNVVAFSFGPEVVVHRVADRDDSRLVTIGDNLQLLDPPVDAEAYLGCVDGVAEPTPRPQAAGRRARDLTGTTVWCPRPPVDDSLVARLAALGATMRVVEHSILRLAIGGALRGLRVAVSSAGAGTAWQIPALLAHPAEQRHLLVGYRFGSGHHAPTGCLSPDLADHHVRPDAPLRDVPLETALGAVATAFDRDHDGAVSVP